MTKEFKSLIFDKYFIRGFILYIVRILHSFLFSNNQVAVGDQTTNGYIEVYNEKFELVNSFKAHTDCVNHIKQSPFSNNEYVATCSDDSTVKIWNHESNWTLIRTYTKHSDKANTIEWMNANTLVSGSFDGTVQIWSTKTGETSVTIDVTVECVISLKLLGDCVHVAVGLSRGNIKIYNLNDGNLVSTLIGHASYVQEMIQISPDLLASSSQDATVRLWNLTTNECKFVLREHVDAVFGLKLVTSDLLASGSWDKTIKLWNITSGELERTLVGHTNLMLWSVDLMPSDDSQTQSVMIASGSWDRKIKLWNWQTGECLNTSNTGIEIRTLAVLDTTTQTSSKK